MLTISLDIDGVFASFENGFSKVVNSIYPNRIPYGYSPKDWDWSEILTKEELKTSWDKTLQMEDFWLSLIPFDHTLYELQRFLTFSRKGVQIYYLTSRPETKGLSALQQTNTWLKWNGIKPDNSSVIVVKSTAQKAEYIKLLGAKYSLDDYGPTIIECNKIEGHTAVLFDKTYNQMYNVPRAKSFNEFLQIIGNDLPNNGPLVGIEPYLIKTPLGYKSLRDTHITGYKE